MDFNTIDKIIDSFQKHPKRTILIISMVAVIAIIGVVFGGYLSELGKKFATDNGTKGKAEPGVQIGEVKTGDQSQVYVGSKVIISGVSPKVVTELSKTLNLKVIERLLKTLDEKDVAIEERDAKLQELSQKYKELEERLTKRSTDDKLADQAKQKLEEGNLEGAEQILLISLDKNLQAKAENMKAAAADAFELGLVKEIQLDYAGAKKFYDQAVQLEPDNTDYMNRLGFISHKLGDSQKANDYYKKALAPNRKAYYRDQRPIPPSKFFTNSIGMEFILIPAGSFTMGSSPGIGSFSERPSHIVKISRPFHLQNTEVTQGQWREVMGDNPSFFKECGDDCPVEKISWLDAQDFINKLNEIEGDKAYRLPTEAEWEYAVRAGSTTAYSFGNEPSQLGEYAWFSSNSGGKTHPVGQKQPNAWGIYDMNGNVREWVEDAWHRNYEAAPNDGRAGIDESLDIVRVLRGCCWRDPARYCRSASRGPIVPYLRDRYVGFRLARSIALSP